MRCNLEGSFNFIYQRLPSSIKEHRWLQISLAGVVVLAVAGIFVVITRSLSGRVSKQPIKPLYSMNKITKVLKDYIILNHSAVIKALQRNLLRGNVLPLVIEGGKLIITGQDPREEMTVQYTKEGKSETLTRDESEVIRRLIFPRRLEVQSSIQEAIQQVSPVEAWANYKFRDKYSNPDPKTPILEILGGGEERIFAVETSDRRIWLLCKSRFSQLYYLSQVESGGSSKTEVFDSINPEWDRWYLQPKETQLLEQLIIEKLSSVTQINSISSRSLDTSH